MQTRTPNIHQENIANFHRIHHEPNTARRTTVVSNPRHKNVPPRQTNADSPVPTTATTPRHGSQTSPTGHRRPPHTIPKPKPHVRTRIHPTNRGINATGRTVAQNVEGGPRQTTAPRLQSTPIRRTGHLGHLKVDTPSKRYQEPRKCSLQRPAAADSQRTKRQPRQLPDRLTN
jgi:hypothetical protein